MYAVLRIEVNEGECVICKKGHFFLTQIQTSDIIFMMDREVLPLIRRGTERGRGACTVFTHHRPVSVQSLYANYQLGFHMKELLQCCI